MPISRTMLLLAASLATAHAATREAQVLSARAAAGVAFPGGVTSEWRTTGPSALLSAEARLSRRWSVRLDGEWSLLDGPTAPSDLDRGASNYQDLRIVGGSLNVVFRPPDRRVEPYLLLGVGAYRLQRVDAARSPWGTTGAVQLGVGVDGNYWRRVNPFVEARAVVHFTDYASPSAMYAPTTHLPVLVGVRIR